MKTTILLAFMVLFFLTVKSQKQDTTIYKSCRLANDPPTVDGDGGDVIFDSCPKFKNGGDDIFKYISAHIRYPANAKYHKVEGRVILSMIIEKNGSLSHIKVERGIGHGCNEEAVRIMKLCPKWTPGILHGRLVRVAYALPVSFRLNK